MKRAAAEREKQGGPSRCSDVLTAALQGLGLGRAVDHLALLQAWDRAIALRVQEHAIVEDFRGGRLYLCVEDPIWMHELHMLRHTLKTRLNEEAGEPVVEEIVLRIGRSDRRAATLPPADRLQRAAVLPIGAKERITELLSPLDDLPCRDALERLLQRWAARSI